LFLKIHHFQCEDAPIPPGVSGLSATPVATTTDVAGDGHAVATVATDNGEEDEPSWLMFDEMGL
jgi:hypothetical protein